MKTDTRASHTPRLAHLTSSHSIDGMLTSSHVLQLGLPLLVARHTIALIMSSRGIESQLTSLVSTLDRANSRTAVQEIEKVGARFW